MGSKKSGDGHGHGDGHSNGHSHGGGDGHDGNGGPAGLTRNEQLVWDSLIAAGGPQKAYEILDSLKAQGVRAPMTVYRALEGLDQKGFIHKLEGINAFVPCKHEAPHEVQVFLICESCASAKEVELESIEGDLRPLLKRASFLMKTARLEARGLCSNCRPAEAA